MRILVALFLLFGSHANARPTSNVINVIYSLPDNFFQQYGLPKLTFKDRVTICETFTGSVYKDSCTVGMFQKFDKYTVVLYSEPDRRNWVNQLHLKLVKDKKKRRALFFIFHERQEKNWERTVRIDVYQYDKNVENRWKTINASEVLPKLTWQDFYQGISEDANKNIFTMRPAIDVSFNEDGSIWLRQADEYIETELKEVQEYLENNPNDANQITLYWDKKKSKFLAKIL